MHSYEYTVLGLDRLRGKELNGDKVITFLLAGLLVQETALRSKEADDVRARASVEAGAGHVKVTLDGTLLYDGPGAKANVDVIEIHAFSGKRFVTVTVDEEEQVRVLAQSLSRPVKMPGMDASLPADTGLRIVTEGATMTIQLVHRGGTREIFKGSTSLGKPELLGRPGRLEVRLAGAIIYRVRHKRVVSTPLVEGDFVTRVNELRRFAGIPEVKGNLELARASDLHALYLAKNVGREEIQGLKAHQEEPGLPGYSEEGARAGRASVIHFAGVSRDLLRSIDGLMATLYHRVQLLEPTLAEIGAGWAYDAEGGAVVVIHVGTRGGTAREEPVLYPALDQKEVPLEFSLGGRETPDPIPDVREQGGYPITIQFSWDPEEATVRLLLEGREIEGWLSTPKAPARADFPQRRVVCLIPKKRLEPGRTYTVEASAKHGQEAWAKTWKFTTVKK